MIGGAFGTDKKSFILLADKLNIGGFVITGAPLFSNNTEDDKSNTFKKDLYSFGIAFNKLEGKTFVMGIWRNSAADNAQIKVGDEVVKINSIKTEELSIIDIVNIV
ncbi:MAG: hypothetical protein JRJ44_00980 [Deltaproteobacteria bacterium]|nr:hypothetical protein [Deltaproteobacteria bacterium]